MTVQAPAWRDRVMEVCSVFGTQPTSDMAPLNQLGEDLDRQAEENPAWLAVIPTWIEGIEHGTTDAAVLASFHTQALFKLAGPWLSCSVPHVCNLDYGRWGNNRDPSRWGTVCPPSVLQWWVMSPSVTFETERAEQVWWAQTIKRTRSLYKNMKDGHPWLTSERLWHDPDWRRVMFDGIRLSPTDKDPSGEGALLMRILNEGWAQLSREEKQAVRDDPCFPRWEASWLANPLSRALWRAHQSEELAPARDRSRRPRV
jgi:hypothetical protein